MLVTNRILITQIIGSLGWTLIQVIATSVVSFLLYEYFLKEVLIIPTFVAAVLGTAIAFFIGFNNSQAYDRWWEARKIWGSLVNDSRTWGRHVLAHIEADDVDTKVIQKQMIHRHIAFLYALKENLRDSKKKHYKAYLSESEFNEVESHANHHNAILNIQSRQLDSLLRSGVIDGFRFLEINKSLIAFSNEMGMSERIKNTVFPTTYQRYTRLFIWVFLICVTLVAASTIGVWSILLGTIIGSVFVITHSIGLALLNPFEDIKTGVSISQITRTIEINLLQTLGQKDVPKPLEIIDNTYIM